MKVKKIRCNIRTRKGRQCYNEAIRGKTICKVHQKQLQKQQWKARRLNKLTPPQFNGERTVEKRNYWSYLQSSEWKEKADQHKKDNPNCSLCNRRGILHTHHRTYVRCGSENEHDLVVLCADCHKLFHLYYEYDEDIGYFVPK